ncbi:MAG: hypothetical protein Tsb009_31830 [Planctomycetaceae bacterium]
MDENQKINDFNNRSVFDWATVIEEHRRWLKTVVFSRVETLDAVQKSLVELKAVLEKSAQLKKNSK